MRSLRNWKKAITLDHIDVGYSDDHPLVGAKDRFGEEQLVAAMQPVESSAEYDGVALDGVVVSVHQVARAEFRAVGELRASELDHIIRVVSRLELRRFVAGNGVIEQQNIHRPYRRFRALPLLQIADVPDDYNHVELIART